MLQLLLKVLALSVELVTMTSTAFWQRNGCIRFIQMSQGSNGAAVGPLRCRLVPGCSGRRSLMGCVLLQ